MSININFRSTISHGFVRFCLCALLMGCFGRSLFSADKEKESESAWDLQLLSTVVPEFKVEKTPMPQALGKLFQLVFGDSKAEDWSSSFQLIDDQGKKISLDDRLITLDLVNAPAGQILDYITELSGCHWKVRGWPGAPNLVIESMTIIDDSERFLYSEGIHCTVSGARLLGLKPDINRLEIKELFKRYGVEFEEEQLVFWDAKTGMLAVRHKPKMIEYIRTLISLSDKGWSLVKTDQQESPNKK